MGIPATIPGERDKYLEMGVKHFCIGTDVSVLFNWFREAGGGMNKLLGRDVEARAHGASRYGR